jgi:hypothetical protein
VNKVGVILVVLDSEIVVYLLEILPEDVVDRGRLLRLNSALAASDIDAHMPN